MIVISGDTGISPVTPTGTSALVDGMTVGRGAGEVSTNTAVGASALAANTTGTYNTAIGASSLSTNTTGGYNVAAGNSLIANTTGNGNAAFGNGTLLANTTGSENTAFGSAYSTYAPLRYNTTGSLNVAVGSGALVQNTTASNNTAVGYQAGYSNTTGSYFCAVGKSAGYSTTTASYGTYFGNEAGYFTTGAQNTFLGQGSGFFVSSGANNTILGRYNGNQGGLDIRTASNYIVLSDGDGNPCIGRMGGQWTLSVTTSFVSITAASAIGTLVFVSAYNTSGGAQGWWLLAMSGSTITTVASANSTGLTVSFQVSSGIIQMKTTSGTLGVASFYVA